MPNHISIGPLTFYFYGLIIAASIYFGWVLAKKRASLYKVPKGIFDDPILLVPLALGIIGARTYHILDYWDFYSQNPRSIFYLANGGLGIWGGLLGIFIGFFIICKVKKLNFLSVLDLVSPSLLLAQVIGRVGNFINQEGFGPPTTKFWGVFIEPSRRPDQFAGFSYFHPTFFYEAILDGIFLLALLYLAKKLKFRGQIFALYLIFYSAARFIAEFWRIDTWSIGQFKVAHLLSTLTFLIGISMFLLISQKRGLDIN